MGSHYAHFGGSFSMVFDKFCMVMVEREGFRISLVGSVWVWVCFGALEVI